MKLMRVLHAENMFYGIVEDDKIQCLDKSLGYENPLPLSEVKILPIATPSKVVCVGLNYKEHARELNMPLPNEPVFFLKAPTTLINHNEKILLPKDIGSIHFEGELVIVIGKECSCVKEEEAASYILGYTVANDVTARDVQKTEILTGKSKNYDTFCPLANVLETSAPTGESVIRTWVNDELKQEATLDDMIFTPHQIIAHLSQIMTLLPGDIVLTGTPSNVGPIMHNDKVRVEVSGIAQVENIAKDRQY